MKIVTPRQMREIDRRAIEETGIPGIVLMENAAAAVAASAERLLGGLKGMKIVSIAGKGNNGGDAFAAARHIHKRGAAVAVCLVVDESSISGDASVNLNIIKKIGIPVYELNKSLKLQQLGELVASSDLVLDGIFGTGLKGGASGTAADVIEMVNKFAAKILSIDIPSGVDGETGKAEGAFIRADRTVTLALPKTGLAVHPGCEYAGELEIADIGIPDEVVNSMDIRTKITDRDFVASIFPLRRKDSNKGDYGKIFIVTGSTGMTGAGFLSGRAALRTGSGLVYLGVPSTLVPVYDAMSPETVTIPLEDENRGWLSGKSIDAILRRLDLVDAAAAGPGLSMNAGVEEVVYAMVEKSEVPLVLDADALNVLASDAGVLKKLKCQAVITPHPGEMARLAGISVEDVQYNRIQAASEFAARWKLTVVLKGSRTVTAFPDGEVYINTTGNPGMATAGSGDVLTGIITSLIGQGMKPSLAAAAGVYLHGLAGDYAALKGEHGLIAGDIAESLPLIMRDMAGAAGEKE